MHEGTELIIECRKKNLSQHAISFRAKEQRLFLLELCSAKSHQGMRYDIFSPLITSASCTLSVLYTIDCSVHNLYITYIVSSSQLFICFRKRLKHTYLKPQSFFVPCRSQFSGMLTGGIKHFKMTFSQEAFLCGVCMFPHSTKTCMTGELDTVNVTVCV